jgi:hypothetical protein
MERDASYRAETEASAETEEDESEQELAEPRGNDRGQGYRYRQPHCRIVLSISEQKIWKVRRRLA